MKTETAHVLMADLVGSTKFSLEERSRLDEALLKAVLSGPVSTSNEEECLKLDSGDGIALVFFGDPRLAMTSAIDLHDKMAGNGTRLRIGIHSGLVTRRQDANGKTNVSGPGIDKAQRTMSCADGSRVLMSEFFAENLRAFQDWRSQLVELGEHSVKHGESLRLYGLVGQDEKLDRQEVVILYRRKAQPDEDVLNLLETRLPALGMQVFVDRHLKIGVEWAKSIEQRIRQADAVIVLISDAAQNSEMVEAELEIAHKEMLERGKPLILPIRIGLDQPVKGPLAFYVSSLQYGFWSGPSDDDCLLESIEKALKNKPAADTVVDESDSGGLVPDSPFYVERSVDQPFYQALSSQQSILLVKGPRQIGKTSLLARGVHSVRSSGCRYAFTDFQKFNSTLISNEEAFYRALAGSLAKQISFSYDFAGEWDPIYGSTMNMEGFLRAALDAKPEPLVWFMDEADKLFGSPFASDFYGLVRSWHNSRATESWGPWKKLTVVIAYATEAHLFIQDLNQSPFNVGRRFDLEEFTREQIETLIGRTGLSLSTTRAVDDLMNLIGGHPFLVRRALKTLQAGTPLSDLLANATRDDGPFGDHLKRILVSASTLEPVLSAVRLLLDGKTIPDQDAAYRLLAAGVVVSNREEQLEFRNSLYRTYLAAHC